MNPRDMLTNPHFCPMPWTGLMYNFDGTVKNCIRSNQPIGNIQTQSIQDIVLGARNRHIQQSIKQSQPVSSCSPCHELERGRNDRNIVSDRIYYMRELKQVSPETYQAGNFDLKTVDVRWTNLCNFACVYCGPEFSSRWAEEVKINLSTPTHQQRTEFKQYILQQAPQLKHVYLAGGEPLLMKENLELLEKLDPEVSIRVNTNLSKTDTQVFEKICQFKNVHWTVSVESLESEFDYIRYGGNWSDFLSNLGHIQQLGHKISFNMIWFLLNYRSIFDCVDFMQNQGFHANSFIIGPLLAPEYLNIRHLPDYVLQLLETELQSRIEQQPGYLLQDSYQNMLHYIQQPFEKDFSKSLQMIHDMDQRRGIDSRKIFKNLYQLREEN